MRLLPDQDPFMSQPMSAHQRYYHQHQPDTTDTASSSLTSPSEAVTLRLLSASRVVYTTPWQPTSGQPRNRWI